MYRVFLNLAASAAFLAISSVNSSAVEVYMFKGAGDFSFVNKNMHFSRGLNKMSDILNSEGIKSEVRRFGQVEDALADIRSRKPTSVAFVGHSMGALASMAIARNLKDEGVEIAYMALIDIPGPVGVAGANVDWVENYFSINPVYGRLTNTSTHPNAKNIHVPGYIHNRMDDAPEVQAGILSAIRKVHAEEQQIQPIEDQPEVLMVQRPSISSGHSQSYQAIPSTQEVSATSQPAHEANIAVPTGHLQVDPSISAIYVDQNGNHHPYPLPSVRPPESINSPVSRNTAFVTDQNAIVLDPATTSSVQSPGVVDRGRQLLQKAGKYIQRSSNHGRQTTIPAQLDR